MNPLALRRTFERFNRQTGIVGVAFGPKQVGNSAAGNPCAVTFFVKEKMPVRGAHRRLADGRLRLPKFVELQGETFLTDVVTTTVDHATEGSHRSPPRIFRAGGKASNMQITGTLGCLVSHNALPGLYALTNQHIGLGPGSAIAFPDFRTVGAIVGTTQASAGLVADEVFLPPFDKPQSYVDVDCALVRIPPNFETSFSPDIPHFGQPAGMFVPDRTNEQTYTQSLLGKQAFSYGWTSGPRHGVISHVYFVYQQQPANMLHIACFLVQSTDAAPPGIIGDSGKLWMTAGGNGNLAIGVHFGVVAQSATSGRFALVTEFSSAARFLNIRLI